jgi:hypothetical protein
MKIICWNIAGGHMFRESLEDAISYDEENLDYFIEKLRIENADAVLLQEAHTTVKSGESQAEIIAKQLGLPFLENHPYGCSHIKDGEQFSLSVLSRFPIAKFRFHKIPNPGLSVIRPNGDKWVSFDVGFLACEIDYNEVSINLVTGHMVPFHYYKRDFAEPDFENIRTAISELFISLGEKPTVIGADFNYNRLDLLLPGIFKDDLYKEGFVGIETTPGRGQQDHMLFSRQWHLMSSEVKKLETDHFLCGMEVSLD